MLVVARAGGTSALAIKGMAPRSPVERFWPKVDQSAQQGCWLWTGRLSTYGYGRIFLGRPNGRVVVEFAHRFSYILHNGVEPSHFVCHHCDVRACVNPAHLYDGDAASNSGDMVARGRSPREWRNAHTKISDADARAIRDSQARGVDLARAYGVSEQTVCDIRKGRKRVGV